MCSDGCSLVAAPRHLKNSLQCTMESKSILPQTRLPFAREHAKQKVKNTEHNFILE